MQGSALLGSSQRHITVRLVRDWEALVQTLRIALVGAAILVAIPAYAGQPDSVVSAKSYVPTDTGGDTIRKVNRGEKLAIACDGVDLTSLPNVRVVLSVSEAGAKKLGYQGVLATDQSVDGGKLQIRVPDAPDFANQTVNVKVFVMNGAVAKSCDAGRIRVV
jgi:hypothetical protein